MTDEEPEFIEPDPVQRMIWHRWRAGQIYDFMQSAAQMVHSFEKMRATNQKVGNVSSLNLYIEKAKREQVMLWGWWQEEMEMERQATLDYEHEKAMRE